MSITVACKDDSYKKYQAYLIGIIISLWDFKFLIMQIFSNWFVDMLKNCWVRVATIYKISIAD